MKEFTLPKQGYPHNEVLKDLEKRKDKDAKWEAGRTFSLVYHTDEEHEDFLQKTYSLYFSANALNPIAFKSVKEMEHETIRMALSLFHGDSKTCGTMTSGGTESLLMVVKTYRDYARKLKPWILKPEMIAPVTIHPAVNKACDYLGVKLKLVSVDHDYKMDVKELRKNISRNTILIMASAPSYPHGVIDPIKEISKISKKKNIPFHVDACFGGFLIPFISPETEFDFSLEGVTSISADFHKYGYSGTKGASGVFYRSMDYLRHQFYIYENWPGGIYLSPSILGSRPGGAVACAYGSLLSLGEEGFLKQATRVKMTLEILVSEIQKIEDLKLVGDQKFGIVCIKSNSHNLDIYLVGDELQKKGWFFDRNQNPESLHFTISPHHDEFIREFIEDLKDSIKEARKKAPHEKSKQASMYGMVANMPLRGVIKNQVLKMMEEMYSASGKNIDEQDGAPQGKLAQTLERVAFEAIEVKKQWNIVKEKIKSKFQK